MRSTLRRFMRTLQRLGYHARQGTLSEVLVGQYANQRHKLNQCVWRMKGFLSESTVKRFPEGFDLRLYYGDLLSFSLMKRSFEINELRLVHHFLRPGDIFFDVGANIGLYTCLAGKRVHPIDEKSPHKGEVHSFEPCTLTYNRLVENVQINQLRNVRMNRLALSDKEETREMQVSQDGYGAWNTLGALTRGSKVTTEFVSCTTLDKYVLKHDLVGRISLIKIDVEGWELRVLRGAYTVLSRDDAPSLLVEFTDLNAQASGFSCAEIYGFLVNNLGYHLYHYDAEHQLLQREVLRQRYLDLNLLATKNIASVAQRLECSVQD